MEGVSVKIEPVDFSAKTDCEPPDTTKNGSEFINIKTEITTEPRLFERVSHPSQTQLEVLVQFLEEKPVLAKGILRNPIARTKAVKEWETITVKLNGISGGVIKTTQKWMKYWSDKKNAVKKKAIARGNAMRRSGGDLETVPELSEIEERIVALTVGAFTTGDRHSKIQVPDEPIPDLRPHSPIIVTDQSNTTTENCHPTSMLQTFKDDRNVEVEMHPIPSMSYCQSPQPHLQASQRAHTPEVNTDVTTENINTNRSSALSARRRRRFRLVRQLPKLQRRSQFATIVERSITIEQQRLILERRIVTVMEKQVEINRLNAQANLALAEGLKALAEAIKKN